MKSKRKKKRSKKRKKINIGNIILMFIITIGIVIASVIIAFSAYIVYTSPEFTAEALYNSEVSVIYWSDGTEMTKLGQENRILKEYQDFPDVLIDALIATEDSRFFQHSGVDIARFAKAAFGQLTGQSGAGGASTLSMQLAKNKYNGTEDSGIEGIIRKFKDIYLAVFKIEKKYTKEEIIEMYLNTWWFAGGSTNYEGIYGVEQASQYYFNKSVNEISLPEAALLVGMVNNPTIYNPYIYPENANNRKNTVLSLMYRHGYITEQEMLDAQSIYVTSILADQKTTVSNDPNQVLIDYVRKDVQENEGINIYKTSYKVYTTFDKNIQQVVNDVINGAATTWVDDKIQTAIAVTSVDDGSIKAIGPGRNYVAQGIDRATDASNLERQPGSTAKPIVDYGPLIEYNNASPQQMFIDFPYSYDNGVNVNNWDNSYKGVMTMKNALSSSRNVTALQAYQMNDRQNVKEFLANLGITEANYGDGGPFEASSIGGWMYGITPLQSAAAYAAFARSGYYIAPYSYSKLVNLETEEVIEKNYEKVKAMSEETAYMITDILIQATKENVAGNVNSNLRATIASKSGTSNIDSATANAKGISVYTTPDHWVNTYNTEYSISFWYGYDRADLDSSHYLTSNSGTNARGKISAYLANNILTKNEAFKMPSNISIVTVEANSLPMKLATEYTPSSLKVQAMFKAGTEPSETSNRFTKLSSPSGGSATVKGSTVTLVWDAAATPKSDESQVRKEFESYFSAFKSQYPNAFSRFETKYLSIYNGYTASVLGTFGYEVYAKMPDGSYKDLGWTQDTNFTYKATQNGNYTFTIKAAYSAYKATASDGITVTAKVNSSDIETNNDGLKLSTTSICVLTNSTITDSMFSSIKITYNGKTITSGYTFDIDYKDVDTSKEGNQSASYKLSYPEENANITGKITIKVSNTC